MSRLKEVEAALHLDQTHYAAEQLARTLAAEVDARDEVITKLLEMLKPGDEDDRMRQFSTAACDRYDFKRNAYTRAYKVAGRTE